jgi:penicillin-binding protein 1C
MKRIRFRITARYLRVIVCLAIAGVFAIGLHTQPIAVRLPTPELSASSNAYLSDRNGKLLHTIRLNEKERRLEWMALSKMSPSLIKAVLAAEDKNFYSHSGVDFLALGAALSQNVHGALTGATSRRGASTISMQLAGLLTESDVGDESNTGNTGNTKKSRRNVWLKFQQMRAAWQLENAASKSEILEAYLNTIYFRGEQRGIEAASQAFFAKSALGLTARESTVLASLIAAPQAKPTLVAQRACRLYDRTFAIDQSDVPVECEALGMPVARLNKPYLQRTDNLVPHVAQRFKTNAALVHGKTLQTSIDYATQKHVQQALSEQLRELVSRGVEDGAVVVLDNQTGEVRAYVGSSGDFSQAAQVDAASALRQAGSTLKPFLYAMAIGKKKLTAASLIDDSAFAIRTADAQYVPRNYSDDYKGWVSVRKALASSLNVPAVRTLAMLDVDEFANSLREIGLSSVSHDGGFYGYSLALGSADVRLLDLTNAYRALATGGLSSQPKFVVEKNAHDVPRRVISAEVAYIVSDMLSDNEARAATFGLDSSLRLPFRASVKTGTSKDMRDNWCIGFSEKYTVGVWVGNASGAPMRGVSGVSGAAPIWNSVMRFIHNGVPVNSPAVVRPAQVVAQSISFIGVTEPERTELFLSGTQSREISLVSQANRATSLIAYPVDGAIYAVDPDIPASKQTLRFTPGASTPINAQWRLNGKDYANATAWKLAVGKHTLALHSPSGALLEQVRFEVRGASR